MSKPDTIEDAESVLLMYSGLNDAFIGNAETYGKAPVACYSKKITLAILEKDFNMSPSEARERYEYEYLQCDYGDATPIFLDDEDVPSVS
tara:strand:+ start:67 stop:336 length:270 start_codon:yes stop_codon:yes gene_type:complete